MASFTYIDYDKTVSPSGEVPPKEENTNSDEKSTSTSGLGTQYYVRLRDLLGFLQNGSSGISSIIPKIRNKGGEDSLLKFDLDVENNLMWLDPFQVSTDPLKCVINKNINFDGRSHTFGVSSMEPFEITKGNYTYGQILNIYINCVFIIDIIKTNTGDDGKIDLYTFLEKILEGINASFSGLNNLTMFIDETTNEVKFVDQNPLPGRQNLITNKQTTKFRMFGYKGGENSFVKDFDFKTEITPQLATMITVGAAANNTVVGADATAISYLNAGLIDRYKNSMYNDTSIDENVKKYEPGWSVKIKENPYGAYGKADPVTNSDGFKKALEEEGKAETQVATLDKMWDQYKDFLKRISTSIDNNADAEDARSATKELIDENRNKLKDLLQYASNTSNIKNIAQIRQNLQERQNASAEANKSLWEKFKDAYNEFAGDPSKPNTSTNSNTTQVENALSPINSKGLSNFTGFIPFNLGLTIDGLSGIKINQKFTVDTDFLPTNYPSTVDFLIKNISHEISNNKWYTKLESYCISKGGSNQSSSETYNTSVGNVSTSGGKIQTSGASSTPSIPVGVEDADIIQKAIAIGELHSSHKVFGKTVHAGTTLEEYLNYMRKNVEGGYGHPLHFLRPTAQGSDWNISNPTTKYLKEFQIRFALGTRTNVNFFEDIKEYSNVGGKEIWGRFLRTNNVTVSMDIMNSGETMYGMDRKAGGWGNDVERLRNGGKVGNGRDDVKNELIEFWDTIDKYSGFGLLKNYSNNNTLLTWNAVKNNANLNSAWSLNYGSDPNKLSDTDPMKKVLLRLVDLKIKIYSATNTFTLRNYLKIASKQSNYDPNKLYDEIMGNGISLTYFIRYTVNGPAFVKAATERWVQQYNTYMKGNKNDIYKLLADNIVYMYNRYSGIVSSLNHTKNSMGFFPGGKTVKNILGQ